MAKPFEPESFTTTVSTTDSFTTDSFMTIDAFDVTVSDGDNDRAIVTKDHSGPLPAHGRTHAEHAAAMTSERDWLRRARGVEGVVQMVDDPDRIVTQFAGSQTLRSGCPGPVDAARVLASVATTVARLAEEGLVHGSVAPEHVIIPAPGRAVLCSPNSSGQPVPDLVGLGRCVEFATEQWPEAPETIAQWLLVARRLQDADPTVGPERAVDLLHDLATPVVVGARRRPRRLVIAAALLAVGIGAAAALRTTDRLQVTGPEVTIDGNVVRVGTAGQIALAHPGDVCSPPRVYVLDPTTFRIWAFDRFDSGAVGAPVAMVPGANELRLEQSETCAQVVAAGPAGLVVLEP